MNNKKLLRCEKALLILLGILYIVNILATIFKYDLGMLPALLIFLTPITFIIYIISLIKYNGQTSILKENKLEIDSTEYVQYYENKFKNLCSLLVWKIISFMYLIEGVYATLVCSCGHHVIKIIPCMIFNILDVLIYFYGFKRMLKKDVKDKNNSYIIIAWTLISFVIYALLAVLFRNDLDALHTIIVK